MPEQGEVAIQVEETGRPCHSRRPETIDFIWKCQEVVVVKYSWRKILVREKGQKAELPRDAMTMPSSN